MIKKKLSLILLLFLIIPLINADSDSQIICGGSDTQLQIQCVGDLETGIYGDLIEQKEQGVILEGVKERGYLWIYLLIGAFLLILLILVLIALSRKKLT